MDATGIEEGKVKLGDAFVEEKVEDVNGTGGYGDGGEVK